MGRDWIVSPHGPIEKLEPNLWVVEGTVPTPGGIKRRMAVIRRADGSLWFWHAVPVDDATLAEITAFGKPEVLVVGHDQHAIDAAPFAAKLGLKIYGPGPNLAALRARPLEMAGAVSDLPSDADVRFEEMEGTKKGEIVGIVRSGSRVSVLFADCVQNNASAGMAFPLRVLGFGGGAKVVPVFRFLFMSDRQRLKAHIERLAATPDLARVVPFHGTVVESDAAGLLRGVAERL